MQAKIARQADWLGQCVSILNDDDLAAAFENIMRRKQLGVFPKYGPLSLLYSTWKEDLMGISESEKEALEKLENAICLEAAYRWCMDRDKG